MQFNPAFAVLALLAAMLSACTTPAEDYPSLAIRDAERVTGTMQPAAPAPYVPPPTPAAVVDRLGQLAADAAEAHRAFTAEVPAVRTAVAAAQGTEPGGESWARAQVALAGLEAARSRAMIALADLDRLYVDAAIGETELTRIASTRDSVAAQVAEQDAALAALGSGQRS